MRQTVLSHLPTDFAWADRLLFYPCVDSTNTLAKQLAAQGAPHGTAVLADRQTGGRGRMGRSFYSPQGQGIYLSVILRPDCPATALMHLTCAAGVATCNATEAACGLRPGIKWTNDLVYGKQKLGGILTELSVDSSGNVAYAIVGIGLNCSQRQKDFPPELSRIATSLGAVTGKAVDRSRLAAALLVALEEISRSLCISRKPLMDRYRADCITPGCEVSILTADTVRHATALDVDDEGALLVRFADGHTEAICAGEVSIRGMYGYL